MRILLAEDDRMIGEAVHAGLKDAAYAVTGSKTARWRCAPPKAKTTTSSCSTSAYQKKTGWTCLPNCAKTPPLRYSSSPRATTSTAACAASTAARTTTLSNPLIWRNCWHGCCAVLRRHGHHSANNELDNGIITLNPATREARRHDDGETRQLTAREYTILHALMQRPGHILSRAELEDKTYGWGEEVESNAIDYLIHALRKKLGADSIRNVRGVGWCVARNGR